MPIRVACIEHNEDERDRVVAALLEMKLEPVVVAQMEEAIDMVRDCSVPLLILPYEGDGFGLPLAMRIKAEALHAIDIILISSHVHPALQQAARELDILAILQWPVRRCDIARAVETHLLKRNASSAPPRKRAFG